MKLVHGKLMLGFNFVFSFPEHQQNRAFVLGHDLFFKRNKDAQVLHRDSGADARAFVFDICMTFYTSHKRRFNIRQSYYFYSNSN